MIRRSRWEGPFDPKNPSRRNRGSCGGVSRKAERSDRMTVTRKRKMKRGLTGLRTVCASIAVAASSIALDVGAQEPIIYPAEGQSQGQQNKDTFECRQWATNVTGFDPQVASQQYAQAQSQVSQSASSPPPSSAQGAVVKGAAGGAIIGGIAGDAGKGAAVGALFGGARPEPRPRTSVPNGSSSKPNSANSRVSSCRGNISRV